MVLARTVSMAENSDAGPSGEDTRVARAGGRLAVGAPGAEALGVDVEADARIEAEADIVVAAAQIVDLAQALHQAGPADVAERDHVDRVEMAVGALRRAVGAFVEPLVAEARDDLDRADHRLDMVLHELERARDVGPFGGRRDLEALAVAFAPHARGADQLPGR